MPKVRVLILDDDDFWVRNWMRRRKFSEDDVEITVLAVDEVFRAGSYRVSPRGLELARAATPEDYDIVVIGNNQGTGMEYAASLRIEMLPRTVVDWNDYKPGAEQHYDGLGIRLFCSRKDLPGTLDKLYDEFVAQIT